MKEKDDKSIKAERQFNLVYYKTGEMIEEFIDKDFDEKVTIYASLYSVLIYVLEYAEDKGNAFSMLGSALSKTNDSSCEFHRTLVSCMRRERESPKEEDPPPEPQEGHDER